MSDDDGVTVIRVDADLVTAVAQAILTVLARFEPDPDEAMGAIICGSKMAYSALISGDDETAQ